MMGLNTEEGDGKQGGGLSSFYMSVIWVAYGMNGSWNSGEECWPEHKGMLLVVAAGAQLDDQLVWWEGMDGMGDELTFEEVTR